MQTLYVKLLEEQRGWVTLRFQGDLPPAYRNRESSPLSLEGIQSLQRQARRDYYLGRPMLQRIGQQLFDWLDGIGWLRAAITECQDETLVLAIDTPHNLAYLPWEALYDQGNFLVERVNPTVIPMRWLGKPITFPEPEQRPLRVLFMATSPESVEPVLDFEHEESEILKATQNTAVDLRVEESGCIQDLSNLWNRYASPFDIFHITGHADIQTTSPYQPYFITETETGDRHHATLDEFTRIFKNRQPRLVFLSGCRTAQSSLNPEDKEKAIPSLAEGLVQQGTPAVLGWARPVTETTATIAAAHFYCKLANGFQIPEALSSVYQSLIQQGIDNWHLLRLYGRAGAVESLVNPMGDFPWIPPPEPAYQFLDPITQTVRVATREEFVGRRKLLQECLRALRNPQYLGVLLWGMGGVGKSTVTARLLERLVGYDCIFVYRGLDEEKLLAQLEDQCLKPEGRKILFDKDLSLKQRLISFFQSGLNTSEQRFVFVLDDFEANLEVRSDGTYRIRADEEKNALSVLVALLEAISQGIVKYRILHRIIITSRYDFLLLPGLDARLLRKQIGALQGADLQKKCKRLTCLNPKFGVDLAQPDSPTSQFYAQLKVRAILIADGNPRLLEWLDRALQATDLDHEKILAALEHKTLPESMTQEVVRFRQDVLLMEVLKQQSPDLRSMLWLGLLYQQPVPQAALEAICQDIPYLQLHIGRAASLGVLEVDFPQGDPVGGPSRSAPLQGNQGCFVRVSRILEEPLQNIGQPDGLPLPDYSEDLYQQAAQTLYQLWCQGSRSSTEEQQREIHRLALLGKQQNIAAEMAIALTEKYLGRSRFREATKLAHDTLSLGNDYRIQRRLAEAKTYLGDFDGALKGYEQALLSCPSTDSGERARILHYKALVLRDHGAAIDEALNLLREALEIEESNGYQQNRASTLHEMAGIYIQQGKLEEASTLYQQVLELHELNQDDWGKAATLHQVATIAARKGNYDEALSKLEESLRIKERIGDNRGKTATLNQIAGVYVLQGKLDEALSLFQQSLNLKEQIGDLKGQASTLNDIAGVYARQDRLQDAYQVYMQALQISERIGLPEEKASTLHNLALHVYVPQHNYEQAANLYRQALEIEEQVQNAYAKAKTMWRLAELPIHSRAELVTMLNNLNFSLEILQRMGSPEAKEIERVILGLKEKIDSYGID